MASGDSRGQRGWDSLHSGTRGEGAARKCTWRRHRAGRGKGPLPAGLPFVVAPIGQTCAGNSDCSVGLSEHQGQAFDGVFKDQMKGKTPVSSGCYHRLSFQ